MKCPRCHFAEVPDTKSPCVRCGFTLDRGATCHPPVDADLEDQITKTLGPEYRIECLLRRGGMSLVYLATELELNRYVALKVLPLQLGGGNNSAQRFKLEAEIAASLDHPHIVPIHRIGATSSLLWFTMKFVAGRSLVERIQETGPLGMAECCKIVEQVASALHYAHRRGIVHRDIKPANIMIDHDGCATVCDFGVAKGFGAAELASLTQTGAALGTPTYISPEHLYGQQLDGRADQYSLAVLAFECLAGRPPFVADSMGEVLRMQLQQQPPRLSEYRPDLPLRISQTLARAMSKIPARRYVNVLDFAEALSGRRPPGGTALSNADTQPTEAETAQVRIIPLPRFLLIPQLMHFGANRIFPHVRWIARAVRHGWAWMVSRIRRLAWLLRPAQVRQLPQVLRGRWDAGVHYAHRLPQRFRSKRLRTRSSYAPVAAAVVILSGVSIKLLSQSQLERSILSWDSLTAVQVGSEFAAARVLVRPITVADSVIGSLAGREYALATVPVAPARRPERGARRPEPRRTPRSQTVVVAQRPPNPEPPDHRAEITRVIDRFVNAIETRDVNQLRRVYPGLTEQDEASWASFFETSDNLKMTASLTDMTVGDGVAEALLNGRYDYMRSGEPRTANVHLVVEFQLGDAGWMVKSVGNRRGEQ